ncbi:hypothetical protein KIN20_028807 [Parelaphostrongylus tenuis]|uniref:ERCC1-like central domain-containing protein n=1 Tax=Parelaphostrongylus tenuis TaxID=148309 RepID=A0AAD5R1F2_PARTN|nr:hypothetical protein KIN20_028807 [Parelaphostrongylus tenuis]
MDNTAGTSQASAASGVDNQVDLISCAAVSVCILHPSPDTSSGDFAQQNTVVFPKFPSVFGCCDFAENLRSGLAGGSRLVVNRRRQEGNPVLKYVRNVRYEWGDVGADFECGPTCGVVYLALKYHRLHPNYILSRLSGKDENKYACRILLTLCNVDEPRHTLRELNLLCYRMDWTLVLCYSVEEAAEYIENFKLSDSRDPAFKLLFNFGTLKAISEASEEQLALCPGLGPIRARNLYNYLRTPFTS